MPTFNLFISVAIDFAGSLTYETCEAYLFNNDLNLLNFSSELSALDHFSMFFRLIGCDFATSKACFKDWGSFQ